MICACRELLVPIPFAKTVQERSGTWHSDGHTNEAQINLRPTIISSAAFCLKVHSWCFTLLARSPLLISLLSPQGETTKKRKSREQACRIRSQRRSPAGLYSPRVGPTLTLLRTARHRYMSLREPTRARTSMTRDVVDGAIGVFGSLRFYRHRPAPAGTPHSPPHL